MSLTGAAGVPTQGKRSAKQSINPHVNAANLACLRRPNEARRRAGGGGQRCGTQRHAGSARLANTHTLKKIGNDMYSKTTHNHAFPSQGIPTNKKVFPYFFSRCTDAQQQRSEHEDGGPAALRPIGGPRAVAVFVEADCLERRPGALPRPPQPCRRAGQGLRWAASALGLSSRRVLQ